jgi:ABC-type glycerol-3-phosphate transport system permease component
MTPKQIHRHVESRRVLSLLWVKRGADSREREILSSTRQDAYITAWCFAGAITTIGLSLLIGASAFGLALILSMMVRWQLKRSPWRVSERFWWYCWIALMMAGVGLAVYTAHLSA